MQWRHVVSPTITHGSLEWVHATRNTGEYATYVAGIMFGRPIEGGAWLRKSRLRASTVHEFHAIGQLRNRGWDARLVCAPSKFEALLIRPLYIDADRKNHSSVSLPNALIIRFKLVIRMASITQYDVIDERRYNKVISYDTCIISKSHLESNEQNVIQELPSIIQLESLTKRNFINMIWYRNIYNLTVLIMINNWYSRALQNNDNRHWSRKVIDYYIVSSGEYLL